MVRILIAAAEAYPLVKTGGLGDVTAALPAALTRLGAEVKLMIPAYSGVLDKVVVTSEKKFREQIPNRAVRILEAVMPDTGVGLWLVDAPSLFARDGGPYADVNGAAWDDNYLRFGT